MGEMQSILEGSGDAVFGSFEEAMEGGEAGFSVEEEDAEARELGRTSSSSSTWWLLLSWLFEGPPLLGGSCG